MDGYFARFYLLPRLAGSNLQMGGSAPQVLASVLCLQNASLSRSQESLVLASVQGYLGISAVARQRRRFLGPRDGVARQDVLAATDVDGNSNDEDDFAAWVGRRGAKKKSDEKKAEDEGSKKV